MQDKVMVVTGATSGIGLAAAQALAQTGARLVLVGRDPHRAETAMAAIRARVPGARLGMYYADLSSLAEVKRLGDEILLAEPRIDVLLNSAGVVMASRQLTVDGLETTFAVNHMAYFVLARKLLPALQAASPARIVNVSSGAHRVGALDFDNLQAEKSFHAMGVYGRSKLANILFTRRLAQDLAGTGVTVNALHPGFVATRLAANNGTLARILTGIAMKFALSPEQGAKTSVYLATSPEVEGVTGGYFQKCRKVEPSAAARDPAAADRLWTESLRIAGEPA